MDNLEGSCVFYVKVGTFEQLVQSKIHVLTVTKMGIVRHPVHHDLIVSVSFKQYPGGFLRQTSPDFHSLEESTIHIWQS